MTNREPQHDDDLHTHWGGISLPFVTVARGDFDGDVRGDLRTVTAPIIAHLPDNRSAFVGQLSGVVSDQPITLTSVNTGDLNVLDAAAYRIDQPAVDAGGRAPGRATIVLDSVHLCAEFHGDWVDSVIRDILDNLRVYGDVMMVVRGRVNPRCPFGETHACDLDELTDQVVAALEEAGFVRNDRTDTWSQGVRIHRGNRNQYSTNSCDDPLCPCNIVMEARGCDLDCDCGCDDPDCDCRDDATGWDDPDGD